MKGILIFNNLNDIVFVKADEELHTHIHKLSIKNGLIESQNASSGSDEEILINRDILVQLFSPLVASYKVMQSQFYNSYNSVECEDGMLVAFSEYHGFLLIGISNSENEELSEVQRRLGIFLVMAKMLYGPAFQMLSESDQFGCKFQSRVNLLSNLIDLWDEMKENEQAFLVEAIERLLINQNLSATSVNLLQKVLEKIRSCYKSDHCFCHAFILVQSKLLALYSCRNASELSKHDILLLILLANLQHSSNNLTEKKRTRSASFSLDERSDNEGESTDSEQFFIPKAAKKIPVSRKVPVRSISGIEKTIFEKTKEEGDSMQMPKIHHLLVFLAHKIGMFAPHMIHTVALSKDIIMVLVSEVSNKLLLSSGICNVLDVLYELQILPKEKRHLLSAENLDLDLKRITDNASKMKLSPKEIKYIKGIRFKWEQMRSCGLFEFFRDKEESHLSSRMDAAVSAMCGTLREAFGMLVLSTELSFESQPSPNLISILRKTQALAVKKLSDYIDYLVVKAERNVTMTSYFRSFPGLVHFVYVDRGNNYLTAPFIENLYDKSQQGTNLKDEVWKMVAFSRRYLESRHLTLNWREGEYCYSYFVWFEEPSGKAIKPKEFPDMKNYPMPGVMCKNFYSKFIKDCFPSASVDQIQCFELYCIHICATPFTTILDQAQRLAASLWEVSGVAHTPLDLL